MAIATAAAISQPSRAFDPALAYAARLGLDVLCDAVREAKELLFNPDDIERVETTNYGTLPDQSQALLTSTLPVGEITVSPKWQFGFRARRVSEDWALLDTFASGPSQSRIGRLPNRVLASRGPDANRGPNLGRPGQRR